MAKEHPVFKIYSTNADLEACESKGEYASRDLAESYAYKWFLQSGCLLDLMVIHGTTHEISFYAISAKTAHMRGECQG